jgi:adenylate cyclase
MFLLWERVAVLLFNILGQPTASKAGSVQDISGKFMLLLALLATADRYHLTRHQVASLLWAEMDDERARHNLRQLVSRIRRSPFEPGIYVTESTISLRKDQIDCDLWVFLRLSVANSASDLERTLALYRGEFCEGIVAQEEALSEWLNAKRREFKESMITAAVRLAALQFENGKYDAAVLFADRALASDNLREDAHRLIMQSLEALGRRGEALRRYDALAKLLEDELDAEPDELTQLLAVGLKQESSVRALNAIGGNLSDQDRFLDRLAVEAMAPTSAAIVVTTLDQETPESKRHTLLVTLRQAAPRFGAMMIGGNESRLDLYFASIHLASQFSREMVSLPDTRHLRSGLHSCTASHSGDVDPRHVAVAAQLSRLAQPGQFLISLAAREFFVDLLDGRLIDSGMRPGCPPERNRRHFEVVNSAEIPMTRLDPTQPTELRPTIAIMPLVTLALDHNLSSLGQIVAEEIIGSISRLPELAVISRFSTAAFSTQTLSPVRAREFIGADYMVGGTCSIGGTNVRLNVEFSDCRSLQVKWSESLICPLHSLLEDNSQIDVLVQRIIATVLRQEFSLARQARFESIADSTLHLGAITLMHQLTPSQFDLSAKMLEALTLRAPFAAAPHAWLAFYRLLRVSQGWSPDPRRDMQLATDSCQRALEIDTTHSIALAVDGHVHTQFKHDFDGAHQRLDAALESNPSNGLAWLFKATLCGFEMRGQQALLACQQALKLSPLDPRRWFYDSLCATAALGASDYATAIILGKRSLQANAAHLSTYRALTIAQVLSGQVEDARKTAGILMRLQPDLTATSYRDRHPSGNSGIGILWAEALRQAGVPA